MDKEAIQKIQDTEALQTANAHLIGGIANDSEVIVLNSDQRLIDIEEYLPNPKRFKYTFKTKYIYDFTQYINEHANENSIIIIDVDHFYVNCTIDHGSPDKPTHRDHLAQLHLMKTSAYAAVGSFSNQPHSQKAVAEFIEDWADNITVQNESGGVMTNPQAVAKIRSMTIDSIKERHKGDYEFAQNMSEAEKIELRHAAEFPAQINFVCIPYPDFGEIEINLRLNLLTTQSEPRISVRTIREESDREILGVILAEKIQSLITAELGISIYKN